jgi:predicted RNA binding protein YcfA (HicA-like mRNA interferase family)
MPRMPSVSAKNLIKVLQRNGFRVVRQRGSHVRLKHDDGRVVEFLESRQSRRHGKKLQMQGARILRNEAYINVRCNDER